MEITLTWWIGFLAFVIIAVSIDLGLFHRKHHEVSVKESTIMVGIWFTLALIFNAGVFHFMGAQKALEFATGYVVELSLSMDNVFVIALIFSHFHVPAKHQHGVLMWGIIGALIMRGILIGVGATLVQQFNWILYIFGLFLVFTGIKMLFMKASDEFDPDKNFVVRIATKLFPVTREYHDGKFFIRQNLKRYATPLFVVLILIETTDLMFAVDSVPAIFAITTDPFIVYTSNVFAILGLRSMYFMLANAIKEFRYLKTGLSLILTFVGIKMLLLNVFHIPISISLAVIISILAISAIASVVHNRRLERA